MSFDALAWAVRQDVQRSSDKLVLLALADRHNTEKDVAYPSSEWIANFGSLDIKTVRASLDRLEASGLISDTGRKVGATKQVKVYFLHWESHPKTEASQKRNSSVFPAEGTQKRVAEPIKEPVASRAKALSGSREEGSHQFRAAYPTQALQHSYRVCCVQWAVETLKWTAADAGREFDRFIDNAEAHGRKYVKWKKAWQNWCRSDFQKTKPAGEDGYNPFKYG